jgi:hypothetical protein
VEELAMLLVDPDGRLYVIDYHSSPDVPNSPGRFRIQRREADGTWTPLARSGGGPGEIGKALMAKFDASGNLYVLDLLPDSPDQRIQRLDRQGRWSVLPLHRRRYIQDFEIDSQGNVYVLENLPNRIDFVPASSIPDLLGDVDGSGEVSIPDVVLTLRSVVGLEEHTPDKTARGDFDADGRLGVPDAVQILRIIVGL